MGKKFANVSFILAIFSSVVGIICIINAAILFFINNILTYLPIISSALLEIVGATSLFIFKNTQKTFAIIFQCSS